jgi:ribulose-phosphate 3-epimerase
MVEAPDRYIEAFAAAGATSLIVHVETCPHLHRTIEAIKSAGMQAGVAINPSTSIAAIDEALDYTDAVLVMTVNPGFGGQKFIHGVLPKMARLAATVRERGLAVDVGVDGGIKADTARAAVEAGARTLVSGSGIFGRSGGVEAAVRALRLAAAGSRPPAR